MALAAEVYGRQMTPRAARLAVGSANRSTPVAIGRTPGEDVARSQVVSTPRLVAGSDRGVFCGCAYGHVCVCHDTSDLPAGMMREHSHASCELAYDR